MNTNSQQKAVSPGRKLRDALARPTMLEVPGVHDGFSARAAEIIGFEAVYVGGGISVSTNLGIPDMGMVTTDELVAMGGLIASLVDIPVILDIDDGGGNPLRVLRAVQKAERAGVAAFHIEDGDYSNGKHFPPRSPGEPMDFSHDLPIPLDAAVERVRAAIDARQNEDTVIIARTDAALVSLDEAITRARAFADLGADVIYPTHVGPADIGQLVDAVSVPVMANTVSLTGANAEERQMMMDAGVKILFSPTAAPLAAYGAAWKALEVIKETGVAPYSYDPVGPQLAEVVRHGNWGESARKYRMVE